MTAENSIRSQQLFPESTVGGLIFNNKGEIFLMKSDKWKGKYCIPGGHIELGESLTDAIKREIKEETNLDVVDVEFHSIQECLFSDSFYQKKHFIFIDFTCIAASNDVVLNDEGSDYVWVDLSDINSYPVETYTLKSIELYLRRNNKSAYIV